MMSVLSPALALIKNLQLYRKHENRPDEWKIIHFFNQNNTEAYTLLMQLLFAICENPQITVFGYQLALLITTVGN